MRKIPLRLLVLIVATVSVRAEAPLVAKVENAIRRTEPGWRCTRGILNAPPPLVSSERPLVVSVWDHALEGGKRESVAVNIFQVDSLADAGMSLSPVREGKVATGWKVQGFKIGDEGYLATFRNGAQFEIHFRKSTIVVRVSGGSFRMVDRFAQHVVAQIDAT